MKAKQTKTAIVIAFTKKEFDTFFAALDSVNEGFSEGGKYADVGKMYDTVCRIANRLSQSPNNKWVSGSKK